MENGDVIGRIGRPGELDGEITIDMPTRTVVIEQRRSPLSIQPDSVRLPFDALKALAAQLILAEVSGAVKFNPTQQTVGG